MSFPNKGDAPYGTRVKEYIDTADQANAASASAASAAASVADAKAVAAQAAAVAGVVESKAYTDANAVKPSSLPVLVTNLNPNPRVVGATSYGVNPGTGGVATGSTSNVSPSTGLNTFRGTWTTPPTGGNVRLQLSNIAVSPGAKVDVSHLVRFSSTSGVSLGADWRDSSGNFLSVAGSAPGYLTPNVEKTLSFRTVTAPAGVAFLFVYLNFNTPTSMAAGDWMEWTAGMETPVTTERAVPPVRFDGSSKGARWTGTANASTSELVVPRLSDVQAAGGIFSAGFGSPEGVVVAGVGAKYTDTAGTNGAIEWIKISGSGNTGWKCTVGDTGWRILASWTNGVQDATNQLGVLAMPIAAGKTGVLRVRRMGDQVMVNLGSGLVIGTTGGNVKMFQADAPWPNSFYPTASEAWRSVLLSSWIHRFPIVMGFQENRTPTLSIDPAGGALTNHTSQALGSFACGYEWPTTLPGVAG